MIIVGQFRKYMWWYVAALIAILVCTIAALILDRQDGIEATEAFEDPVALAGLPEYVGVFSYLNATSLIVAGAIMLFAAWSALDLAREMRWFLGVLGGFFAWLGLDDVFMIHEWVGLRLAWLLQREDAAYDRQWLESVVFAAYGIAWICIMILFRKQIVKTAWTLLAFTLLGFGASVGLDMLEFVSVLPDPQTQEQITRVAIIEDLAKLAGSFFAVVYAIQLSRASVRGEHGSGSAV